MLIQRKFVHGLNASTPAYNQPQGSLPRGSNIILTKRGGLRITYGSATYTLQDGVVYPAAGPIADIMLLQIYGVTSTYIGIMLDVITGLYTLVYLPRGVYNHRTNLIGAITPPTGATVQSPRLLQFNNQVILTLGNQITPHFWSGYSGLLNTWQASQSVTLNYVIYLDSGSPLIPNHVFKATYVSGMQRTGATPPVWNYKVGQTTSDNEVTWTYLGQESPVPITNQFQVVYPQWSPTQTITSNAVIQVGFTGADNVAAAGGIGITAGMRLGYWIPNHQYTVAPIPVIIDSNNNVQVVVSIINGRKSGGGPPVWNTEIGQQTDDNGNMWGCIGPATFYTFLAVQSGITSSGQEPPLFTTDSNNRVQDGSVVWQALGLTSQISKPPRGARSAVIYAGALWVLNTSPYTTSDLADGPTCLRMSELNNPNAWNPINIAFLGKDDGTVGTGLATFTIAEAGITPTGSLVAFKDYSTYQIIGIFGSPNFTIIQAQTDMGCIATNSIQFIPGYGIARLTHLGPAIFDGVRDQLFGEEIRPYIFGDVSPADNITVVDAANIGQSFAAQATDPPMYLLACPMPGSGGGLTRLFCYDLVLKAWTLPIDLPWPIACIKQIRRTGQGLAVVTVTGGFNDGSVREVFHDDTEWADTPTAGITTPVSWNVRTPEVFAKSASEGVYTRGLWIRGSGLLGGIKASIVSDSGIVIALPMKQVQLPNGDFEAWLPMHVVGKAIHAEISGSGPGEIYEFDWDADPQPAAPMTLI